MESYAQVLNYAIPLFIGLIVIEAIWAWKKGMAINRGPDIISSLSSGMTNTIKDVLGLSIIIISYSWLVDHIALFEIKATWAVYLVGFIVIDFAGYWIHRLEHEINILWNRHIIHHSSEEFNLSCALRQSISNFTSFIAIFMIPAALLGVPAKVIAIIAPIQLFMQFWYHTRLIDRMGWLENIIVTPSHHRVHHAINPQYLDKNYSQIFIVWDKLFGTFQPELEDVPPVYGVKRQVNTWNPILINFQHVWLLVKDAWRAKSWADKCKIWFMPTGWRPKDVAEKHPIMVIEDPYSQEKYNPTLSNPLLAWSWIQMTLTLVMMLFMFSQIAAFDFSLILMYGLFLVVSIYSFTTLMDKHGSAIVAEAIRLLIGLFLVYQTGGWFGLEKLFPFAGPMMIGYLAISFLLTIAFLQKIRIENKDRETIAVAG